MNLFTKFIKHGIPGIPKNLLTNFNYNPDLQTAIKQSIPYLSKKKRDYQKQIMNFYNKDTIVPYSSISAKGPWIVTSTGAILYDVGGYGMLGFGHSPRWALDILSKPHVMANVMTPNMIHEKYTNLLQQKIGIHRDKCPYEKFAFLNSGSESIELAKRIIDTTFTNKKSFTIVLKNSFHGRTSDAAKLSNSTLPTYQTYLESYQSNKNIKTVEINNTAQFQKIFKKTMKKNWINSVFMEPVMGEGNPGIPVSPDFYNTVRTLTKKHNIPLVIDSIQAGLRTTGFLSIADYPGINQFDPPDMEIFSKAIASGQYPLSILAVSKTISDDFKTGLYGNTMTGNPKALEIGYETLIRIDSKLRKNIQEKGIIFKNMLTKIKEKYPDIATNVTGTGLLLALHIKEKYRVVDEKGLEYICRKNGLNVIHGGKNALRFTPYFNITKREIELVYLLLDKSFQEIQCDHS